MATQPKPDPDPIAEEGRRILRENPKLRARLREFNRKLDAGEEVKVHDHARARRLVGLDDSKEPDA